MDFPMCDWTPLQYLWDKGVGVVLMLLVLLLAVMRFVFLRVVVYGIQTSFRRERCRCCDAKSIKYRVNEKDSDYLEEWERTFATTDVEREALESSDEMEMEEEEEEEEENDGLTKEERLRKKYLNLNTVNTNPSEDENTRELQEGGKKEDPKYE